MSDPKNEDFLDDIAEAEAEALAEELGEIDEQELAIEELIAERDKYKDMHLRALADAENQRKRAFKERRDAENYGGAKLARDMLSVYDNLKRAVEASTASEEQASAALVEGVELTMRELLSIFGKHGIEVIAPEVGDKFDPQIHEAMFEAPVPGTKSGEIIQVSAEGFMLHDRLLRAAKVGVSSNPA